MRSVKVIHIALWAATVVALLLVIAGVLPSEVFTLGLPWWALVLPIIVPLPFVFVLGVRQGRRDPQRRP